MKREEKRNKIMSRFCAFALALAVLCMSSYDVLAASMYINALFRSGTELTGGTEILSWNSEYSKVYIDGVQQGEFNADAPYVIPDGTYYAIAEYAVPDNTEKPYDLYLTTVESGVPTPVPTEAPTPEPTVAPTEEPTPIPTEEPTPIPTEEPSIAPTEEPTPVTTEEPTIAPSEEPTPVTTEEPAEQPTQEPTIAPTQEPLEVPSGMGVGQAIPMPTQIPATGGNHVCVYKWIVTLEPTLEADGICSYMCEECDGVLTVQPISKYHAILKMVKEKIESAPQGATIEISYDFLQSLPKDMVDLIDERKDLTIKITFKSNKIGYWFTIPTREEDNKLAEEGVEYYGLHYLGDKFGKQEIKK